MASAAPTNTTFRIRVCRMCRVRRRFRPRGAWETCDGGQSRVIVCDWCRAIEIEHQPPPKEAGTPDCNVARG